MKDTKKQVKKKDRLERSSPNTQQQRQEKVVHICKNQRFSLIRSFVLADIITLANGFGHPPPCSDRFTGLYGGGDTVLLLMHLLLNGKSGVVE